MELRASTKRRVAKQQATGIHHVLWPDLSKATLTRAHKAIWDATAERLAGGRPDLSAEALGGRRPLSVAAVISGMGGLLGYWIQERQLNADDEAKELFGDYLDHGRRSAYKMETGLVAILRECRERSVTPTVLKGAFTARKYFPEPGTRPSADIDLLIRPEDLPETRESLTAAGFRQATQPAFGTEVWKPRDSPQEVVSVEMDHADNPWSIDVHTSIDRPYFRGHWSHFGRIIFANTERWILRQQQALVFRQPLLLSHLAQHASRDIVRFRIVRLVELVFVIRQDTHIDWDECLRLLDQCGVTRFVYPAFALAERLAPSTVEPGFLNAVSDAAPSSTRKAVRQLADDPLRSFFRRSPAERIMWTNGFQEKLLGWSDVVWPTGHSWSDQWRIVWRRLRMLAGR
jgi:hypothetical protein